MLVPFHGTAGRGYFGVVFFGGFSSILFVSLTGTGRRTFLEFKGRSFVYKRIDFALEGGVRVGFRTKVDF